MAFDCPPELLLRTAVRTQHVAVSRAFASGLGRTYRAAVCEELGKPLQIRQLPQQTVQAGQVRIRIHHVGINFADILLCQGKYQEKPKLPFVPGVEGTGQILEIGSGVTHFQPGENVLILNTDMSMYAEEVVCSAEVVIKIPPHVSLVDASAVLSSYATAYMALKRTANIQPGETMLVTAAAGSVGLAAVELATKVFGATVIGAAGSAEKCDLVLQKGAKATINYSCESIRDKMKQLTQGKGADIILEHVGGNVFMECIRSVAFEGRIVVIGFASGVIPKVPANILLVKSCSVHGLWAGKYKDYNPAIYWGSIEACLKYLAYGKIKPHISQQFPLEKVNEAFDYILSRKSTGKVLLKM